MKFILLAVCLSTLCAYSLTAQIAVPESERWGPPNSVLVEEKETAFTSESIGSTKNESIFVWVYGEDDTVFLFSLFHIDTFLIDRWGMYALFVDAEGESHWFTQTPRTKSITHSEDRLSVTDGVSAFEGTDGMYRLECDFDGLECTIEIESRLPPWKAGSGRVDYNEDGTLYQKRILVSPWAHATGHVVIDGSRHEFSGHGYVSKTRFSNPLTRFAPYIHALKLYSEDTFVYLLDVTLNDAYDNRVVPMLVVAENDEWLFTTHKYEYEVVEFAQAEGVPYPHPRVVNISSESDGYRLEGTYEESRFLNVTDVFAEIPRFVRRMLTLLISRPVYIRTSGSFTGTLTRPDGEVTEMRLSGPYEYTVVR